MPETARPPTGEVGGQKNSRAAEETCGNNSAIRGSNQLKNILPRLNKVKPSGNGYTASCPDPSHVNGDSNPSLSISEDAISGKVLLKCHAGCRPEAIVSAIGLTMADLFPDNGNRSKVSINVETLARDKGLPLDFLRKGGVRDIKGGGVEIPYKEESGKEAIVRFRFALSAKEGSRWPTGSSGKLIPYGLPGLKKAKDQKFVIFVEGESDTWTLAYHGFPVLGIPGADMSKVLKASHVEGLEKIYLFQEPDKGGETFIDGMAKHLSELDFKGEVRVVKIEGVKDPNELHKEDPEAFKEVFQKALDDARLPEESLTPAPSIKREACPWPTLNEAAFYGLAGEIVRVIEPHTEADSCAILFQFLAAFGNAIGRRPHFRVEADKHHGNLFLCLVGESAKGRKGTSWGRVKRLFKHCDPSWVDDRIASGLSSGEGLRYHVRDPRKQKQPIKEKGRVVDYQDVEVDAGVTDKRLLVVEGEFSTALKLMEKEGNILSAVIRCAWDSGDLQTLKSNDPIKATGAHICIIGHITKQELLRYLTATESGNGFANRFLWLCTRRSKELPEGGCLTDNDLSLIINRLSNAYNFARNIDEIKRDDEAREIWRAAYHELSMSRPGLLGSVTARGEAQVVRFSMLYALLDCSNAIRKEHLLAAMAAWKYSEDSAAYIFGNRTGDKTADKIEEALRERPQGMTREQISELFKRNLSSHRIEEALGLLSNDGRIRKEVEPRDKGRPAERWRHNLTV